MARIMSTSTSIYRMRIENLDASTGEWIESKWSYGPYETASACRDYGAREWNKDTRRSFKERLVAIDEHNLQWMPV